MSPTSLLVVEDESIVAMDIKHRAEAWLSGCGNRCFG